MKSTHILFSIFIIFFLYILAAGNSGCAQIGAPTGGPRDSIPPQLVSSSPKLNGVNVTGNKITLTFDEYINLVEPQTNVLVSPFPKKNPSVDYKLKTVTVKLKDTLLPNTTYSINFGKAIVDNNEGNAFKDFTYVFSTGKALDTLQLSGKVLIAENAKADSTIIAMLYRNANDSSVQKTKPDYIAKLSGDGNFRFVNLPAGKYNIYALKDGDGGKTYNSKKEMFAFLDNAITVSETTEPVILYASALVKDGPSVTATKSNSKNKKLIYSLGPGGLTQDLLNPFEITFNGPLKNFEAGKLVLKDTNYKPIPSTKWTIDSSRTKITLTTKWQEGMQYRLVMDTTAFSDSADNHLAKADTIKLTAKTLEEYGNVVLRFANLDLTKNPVLQLVQGEDVKKSYPITSLEWSNKYVEPGEYQIRILYDANKNGKWDPGDYSKKLQPEKVISLEQKLGIRANWDNEREVKL